eukprot:TRINITY_DN13802_c0_g1_i4.p1 TRINITY_DN13802_c0_g1~~TRINITY_DN13802_c0_g1_i4.p1  ORF type:complete len:623 (+),score=79.04 TRINITY_DN13802_c0_g1_i4:85-1953(+)
MIRRPPRSTLSSSSAASDVYKRQVLTLAFTTITSLVHGIHWYQRHCVLVGFIANFTELVFVLWSAFAVRVLLQVVSNPFRAYGAFRLRHSIAVFLLSVIGFLLFVGQSSVACSINGTCSDYMLNASMLYISVIMAMWVWLSVRTLHRANSLHCDGMTCTSVVRQHASSLWRRFCVCEVCESILFFVFSLFRMVYPCIWPEKIDIDHLSNDVQIFGYAIVLAFGLQLLIGAIILALTPDPQFPSKWLILCLFKSRKTNAYNTTLDAALRLESLECITRGIVASIRADRESTQVGDLSAQLLPVVQDRYSQDSGPTRAWKGVVTQSFQSSSQFEFLDFAPAEFREVRHLFGVEEHSYLEAIQHTWERNGLQMQLSNSRSGAFFYFTHDNQFMVKSLVPTEVALLRRMLPSYMAYVREHPCTLLPQFFGCHAIRYGRAGELVHFMVLANINHALYVASDGDLARLTRTTGCSARSYDIKGSTVNRTTVAVAGTRKDNDLRAPVLLSAGHYDRVTTQLELDTQWLLGWNIMDYSLLLTVVDRTDHAVFRSQCCVAHPCCESLDLSVPFVCIGLIDVLQEFDVHKMGELGLKSVRHCSERAGLSCIPPQAYQERFATCVKSKVFKVA